MIANLVRLAVALRARMGDTIRDLIGLAGAGLVAYGAGEIYRPAGFIVGGLFLLVGAFLTAKARG
jgi:hypothetical protein